MKTGNKIWSLAILAAGVVILALAVVGWSWKSTSAASTQIAGEGTFGSRTSQGGRVAIEATWNGPEEGADALAFQVVMDTHSVDLNGYDLAALSVLRNDRGQELVPSTWDAPEGDHHRSGILTFPEIDELGGAFLGPEVGVVELVIRDVAGAAERIFTWEVS